MHVCISACLQMCVNHLVCASYICVLCVDTLVFECMCPPLYVCKCVCVNLLICGSYICVHVCSTRVDTCVRECADLLVCGMYVYVIICVSGDFTFIS